MMSHPTGSEQQSLFHAALLECINMDFSHLDQALRQIVLSDAKVTGAARVSVWLYDEQRTGITCRMQFVKGGGEPADTGVFLPTDSYPAYFEAVENSRVVAADDAQNDPRTAELGGYLREYGIRSLLDVAVRSQGRNLGVLCHEHLGPARAWTTRDMEFAVSMADMVSLALEMDLRRKAESRLSAALEQFTTLARTAGDAIITIDGQGNVSFWNQGAQKLFGRDAQYMMGRPLMEIMPERFRELHKHGFETFRTSGLLRHAGEVLELAALDQNGREFPVELTLASWEAGGECFVTGIVRDITERKTAEAALRDANEKLEARVLERTRELDLALEDLASAKQQLQLILDGAGEGILGIDRHGLIGFANPAACQMVGYPPDGLLGRSPHRMLHHTRPDGKTNPEEHCRVAETLKDGERRSSSEEVFYRSDGSHFPVEYNVAPLLNGSGIHGAVMVFKDITERKRHEAVLKHQAFHDALTGLPNRAMLLDRLQKALDRVRKAQSPGLCLMFLDLDDFKLVNDSLGHTLGDELLVQFATRLSGRLPGNALMARLGGDEFAVLVEDAGDEESVLTLARQLLARLSGPMSVRDYRLYVSACIGMVSGCRGYDTPEDILRDADTAMYKAKTRGKGELMLFDRPMHEEARKRLDIETGLRHAVRQGAFELHYQPLFRLQDGGFAGFEALIRWPDPKGGGLIPPMSFIPVAEQTGLISPIGDWVLRQACRDIAAWSEAYPSLDRFFVAVNLSGKQFMEPGLARSITEVIRAGGVSPGRLKLEITETEVMQNPDVGIQVLTELKNADISLFVDDFGTGYSSLSYLRRLPIDGLKVDRSFVAAMIEDKASLAIVRAVVDLARNMDLTVVAEGVETREQHDTLKGLGCDLGQGWLYARPLGPAAAAAYLEGVARSMAG
ncbi:putative signaling protein [Fundidesulfovibrio magnetotacticus]|uniref:Putative signaling protein n=1 Tax=Fundidesulfovibrio magnetotacticus TaxID=2730080 RepID=A0A6V8LSY0_9BACT|nr:EAL domain-containing protein [Fundidesulfovibrio magnetotacticus]GFK92916.1 putative signaling protein [Fundidesulfovibrio magnetotacticus]